MASERARRPAARTQRERGPTPRSPAPAAGGQADASPLSLRLRRFMLSVVPLLALLHAYIGWRLLPALSLGVLGTGLAIGMLGASTLLQPLVANVPLQLFACELATLLGHDVDQPRNLAKSVTVE